MISTAYSIIFPSQLTHLTYCGMGCILNLHTDKIAEETSRKQIKYNEDTKRLNKLQTQKFSLQSAICDK